MREPYYHQMSVPRAIIVATYLTVLGQATLLFYADETVLWLGLEDGPIENIGALCFLLASAVFLVTAYRSWRLTRRSSPSHFESPLALCGLGVLCFICFGEEISWGQRLLDYAIPVWLGDLNRQSEWNLHNLAWFHAQTVEGGEKSFWARLLVMDRLLALFQLTLCTLVPVCTAYSALLRTWAARIGLPIVPWWIAGIVPAHILTTQALYAIVGDNILVGDALDEAKESVRAFIFLLVAVWMYRVTCPTSLIAREQDSSDRSQVFRATS